jgi:hypothetical protein
MNGNNDLVILNLGTRVWKAWVSKFCFDIYVDF